MIKANELRIGNLVMFRDGFGGEHFTKVHSIHEDMAAISAKTLTDDGSHGQGFMRYEGLHPIPLTPEILEAAGFDDNKLFAETVTIELDGWQKDGNYTVFLNQWESETSETIKVILYANIQYLHQLQNLYYALTGTELTVSLTEKVNV